MSGEGEMTEHIMPRRTYLLIFGALLALTALTVAASSVELGRLHLAVGLTIAIAKALLVVMFFMHVLHSGRLIWLVIGAALFWLGIMLALTLSDYETRDWLKGATPEMQRPS